MSKRNQFKNLLSSTTDNLGANQKEQIVSQYSSLVLESVPQSMEVSPDNLSSGAPQTASITETESKTLEESTTETTTDTTSTLLAKTTSLPVQTTIAEQATPNDDMPGGYETLNTLLQRFRYLHYDYYEGSLQSDHLVEDDYTNKSVWIDKSMLQEIDMITATMRKKKGFHKQIMNTGLRIALDLYKLQLESSGN